jgi:WD40 repeat protein
VGSGHCLRTFEGHTGGVNAVALSGDGRWALSGSNDKTLKLWEVGSGRCVRTFEGHTYGVTAVALSGDGRWALSGSGDNTLILWFLDWELADNGPADWDEGARPVLEVFLSSHTSYLASLPTDRQPSEEEITRALTRGGKPAWTDDDFQQLLGALGCAGYGWLNPEGVRRELEKMAAEWKGPPPL